MAVSDEQIAFVQDLFAGLGPIATRKMFGGLGIYSDGRIFAILMSDGTLKLKGAGPMAQVLDAEGWDRWTYARYSGVTSAMPYWTMPEALLDDADAACDWGRRALATL